MSPDHAQPAHPMQLSLATTPAAIAAWIVIGSTMVAASLLRTYTYSVSSNALEIIRHFNVIFIASEALVFCIAVRNGLDLRAMWLKLRFADKLVIALWGCTFWIGSAFAELPYYSLIPAISWPVHCLFGVGVWHLARQRRRSIEAANGEIGTGIAVMSAMLLLVTAVHFATPPDPASLPDRKIFWAGAIPGFLSVRLFGVMMAYVALFGAGMLLGGSDRASSRLGGMMIAVGVGAMCWSSTRAAVPAFCGALVIAALLLPRRRRARDMVRICAFTAMGIVISIAVPAPDASYGVLTMFGDGRPGNVETFDNGRAELWRRTIAAIAERPFFGHGEGALRWLALDLRSGHVQPHNIFLQIFLHWGAVAACAALWLSARIGWALVTALRRDAALAPYVMIAIAALIAAQFDGALYYPQMVMFCVAAVSFALARQHDSPDRHAAQLGPGDRL